MKYSKYKQYSIIGLEYLQEEKITKGTKINRKFPLKKVTIKQLKQLRKSEKPYFILKLQNRFYVAEIPKNLSLMNVLLIGAHKCAEANDLCYRLSAAPDEEGGCAKIRQTSCGIEQFSWILSGYETIHTTTDVCIVLECEHYTRTIIH